VEPLALLAKTFLLRPYVFGFLAAWSFVSAAEIGLRRSAVWLVLGYAVALACEASSITNGFPFGLYHYFPEPTRDRELWVAGVPFMDSLSFVFLSSTSWVTARRVLGRGPAPAGRIEARLDEIVLGAALMVAIDLVCDPVALQGERWFLGRLYDYAERGAFFGVPLSNFLGWGFLGLAILGAMAGLERVGLLGGPPRLRSAPGVALWAPALWSAIVLFNVGIAFWIELDAVGWLGLGFVAAVGGAVGLRGAPLGRVDGHPAEGG
jgi:putative membrane protein